MSLHEGCPDRSRRNSVAPDPLLADDLVAEAPHERDDGALGGRVVEELWVTDGRVDGRVEVDAGVRALLKKRHGRLDDVEERVDVDIESAQPLLGWQLSNIGYSVLVAMVQDA